MRARLASVPRWLTLATFVPAALTLVALPFGLVDEEIAVLAAIYGLYFVLPAVVAWTLESVRTQVPRWAQRMLGILILLVAAPAILFFAVWTLLFFGAGVPPAVVVVAVGIRFLTAARPDPPLPSSAAVAHER